MNLEPIKNLIEVAGFGTFGEDLFIGFIPVKATKAVMLREPFGGIKINYDLPKYFKGTFTLVVRGNNYLDAQSLCNAVIQTITLSETQVGGMYFKYMRPRFQPVPFPISDAGIVEFNCTMEICFCETS